LKTIQLPGCAESAPRRFLDRTGLNPAAFSSFFPNRMTHTSNSAAVSQGSISAMKDVTIEPTNSKVANNGLPNPAVVALEVPLASTVAPCTKPATPPPAMIAMVHFNMGSIFVIIAAVTTVPAKIDAGVASVSKK
jgi:hypothetical protein